MGLQLYDTQVESRLLLGSSRYPSPAILLKTIQESRTEIVTVSLRRESGSKRSGQAFWSLIGEAGVRALPNTAGCNGVKEAVTTAHMAREVFDTTWIKLEVIGENDTLAPDVFGTVEAARILCSEGFEVFPYTTDDLVVADKLVNVGCRVLMPLGAPIGSAQGLNNPAALTRMRGHFPDIPLIVDAGIGLPSHAASVMEMGYDAVLLNSAVALAGDPVLMGRAFALAIEAGNLAYRSDALEERDMASPSTPVVGKAWLV